MARIFHTGFEFRATGGVNTATSPDGFRTGSITSDTAVFRSGLASVRIASGTANTNTLSILPRSATLVGERYFRVYFRKPSNPSGQLRIIGFHTSATPNTSVGLYLQTNGTLQMRNASAVAVGPASAALSSDVWYRLEVRHFINGANVEFEARIDGTTFASGILQAGTGIAWYSLHAEGTATAMNVYFDDLAINTATGTVNNSWPGDGSVRLMLPVSDNARLGTWAGGAGGTTNLFDAVNNTPPIGASTANDTNLTQIRSTDNSILPTGNVYKANLPTYTAAGVPAGGTIDAVQCWVCHAEEVATGSKSFAFALQNNPDINFVSFNAGDDAGAVGAFPTNWRWGLLTTAENPTIDRAVAPIIGVWKTNGTTTAIAICAMGLYASHSTAVPSGRRRVITC